ncbi:UDP-N-acetylmuramyl-tripeptide synthetase [Treponema lecithinolyticum]|uniref:UDP-N-acetylmuramyl-tripeptide synthetase n=1 Tax=Treponema lecithinolyticum TaxID=53418 RepID=UPI0028E58077|nr:UDP-N-acetylmuramyl-tripeptide synthetase [Treponema lecithinolyticum]
MEKKLAECLAQCSKTFDYKITLNSDKNPVIKSLVFDSKAVNAGSLFFALPGTHVHGNSFVAEAVKSGACAVVYEGELGEDAVFAAQKSCAVLIQTKSSRFAMSPIAAAFYDFPGSKLCILGVTGTEGKSSTVFFIWQFLRALGKKAGFISTVQYSLGGDAQNNSEHQTTPEAPIVQEKLYRMVQNGCAYAVVEASSHGLSVKTNRLGDVPFDAVCMMNVTHEHLEFHGTYEQYKSDKANLFRNLGVHSHEKFVNGCKCTVPVIAAVNAADPAALYFADAAAGFPLAFFVPPENKNAQAAVSGQPALNEQSVVNAPDKTKQALLCADTYTIENVSESSAGITYDLTVRRAKQTKQTKQSAATENAEKLHVQSGVFGAFNACNITAAAILAAAVSGESVEHVVPHASALTPVRGRMTSINCGQPFSVLVDYAHTPSSFQTIFPPLRKNAPARIISVFGSGGERDTQKRPLQGKIAAEYSDIVILADEDPRGENPMELLEMIAQGCSGLMRGKTLFLIPDRKQALRKAFALAREKDTVLLLGKAHENSIIYKDKIIPYDEIAEAAAALAEMGFTKGE